VPLCEQVRVDVVVRDGTVLIGSGHAVDPEPSFRIVVTERAPEARCLDEQLEADLALECLVAGGRLIAGNGVGDVGAYVEGRRPSGPVAGALLAADRAPRENAAGEAELCRALAREVERRMPPAQCVAGGMRSGVGEDREDEPLGVPERVAVVTRARQAFRRDRTLLRARAGLERVEEGETDRLLELG